MGPAILVRIIEVRLYWQAKYAGGGGTLQWTSIPSREVVGIFLVTYKN